MLPESETSDVSRRRALLTDRERELLKDEDAGDQRYVAVSRVRTKIQDELIEDVSILQESHPELYEEIRDVVCEGTQEAAAPVEEPPRDVADTSPPSAPPSDETTVVADESDIEDDFQIPGEDDEVELPELNEITDDVWSVVNEVSSGWDDDDRLETRRKAAATAVQYALTHDVYLGKSSDAVEAIREKYPVEAQKPETWWKKNVRDVLSDVGTYSRGHGGYAVEDLDDA